MNRSSCFSAPKRPISLQNARVPCRFPCRQGTWLLRPVRYRLRPPPLVYWAFCDFPRREFSPTTETSPVVLPVIARDAWRVGCFCPQGVQRIRNGHLDLPIQVLPSRTGPTSSNGSAGSVKILQRGAPAWRNRSKNADQLTESRWRSLPAMVTMPENSAHRRSKVRRAILRPSAR